MSLLPINLINKKKDPIVEEVFLIHEDGRLISYASLKRRDDQDEDIASCMLTAVKDVFTVVFLKKKAKGNVGQYKFELGERNVILKMVKYFYIALVINGNENTKLIEEIDSVIMEIQNKFGEVLKNWDGIMEDVEEVNLIIMRLLPLDELSEGERQHIKDKGLLQKAIDVWNYLMEED